MVIASLQTRKTLPTGATNVFLRSTQPPGRNVKVIQVKFFSLFTSANEIRIFKLISSTLPLKIVSVCQGVNFRIVLDHYAKVIILKFTAKLSMWQQLLLLFVVILITVINNNNILYWLSPRGLFKDNVSWNSIICRRCSHFSHELWRFVRILLVSFRQWGWLATPCTMRICAPSWLVTFQ